MIEIINIGKIFDAAYNKLVAPNFGKSLGGELPIYIQPIPIRQQDEVDEQVRLLINRLNIESHKKTIEINIYKLCIDILKNEELLETILKEEKEIDDIALVQTLDNFLDIKDIIIPKIEEIVKIENPKFVILTGVGATYPFLRSHTLLHNIPILSNDISYILIFPGEYNNQKLSLFGTINDENYYRAHNLNNVIL